MADKTEKTGAKKGEKSKKTTESDTTKQQRITQLGLKTTPISTRSMTVLDKTPGNCAKKSSRESPLYGAPEMVDTDELTAIQESLNEIKGTMVKKSDIEEIVSAILCKLREEIKTEIKEEIKEEIKAEIKEEIANELEQKLDENSKQFNTMTKEMSDGFSLDFNNLQEKFHKQASEFREMSQKLKKCLFTAEAALKLSNSNQQYSQKNNIKFTNWKENKTEKLREDLIQILKSTVGIELDPHDVLEIHRIPGGGAQNGPRPVIAKFRNSETKIRVIRKRQDAQLKKHFFMHDHLTTMNGHLIRDLNNDDRIDQAWYFNGKVFALDNKGKRHKFDVLDQIGDKLRT